jgi:ATP-dependent Clp protease ATP-binding subunit ClpA
MTSNLGSQHLAALSERLLHVRNQAEREGIVAEARAGVMEEVRRHFRPELINRIDEIVIFNPLQREQIAQIVDIQLRGLRNRLNERAIELVLTPAAKEYIAREGFDPVYGARPLKRAIQREIVQPLAMRVLRAEVLDGDRVVVDVEDGQIVFRTERGQGQAADRAEPLEPAGAGAGG